MASPPTSSPNTQSSRPPQRRSSPRPPRLRPRPRSSSFSSSSSSSSTSSPSDPRPQAQARAQVQAHIHTSPDPSNHLSTTTANPSNQSNQSNPSTLEPLLSHFLAAKRALAQTTSSNSFPTAQVNNADDAEKHNNDSNSSSSGAPATATAATVTTTATATATATTTSRTPILRANDLVTAARSAVEVAAILRARAGFLRRILKGQIAVLKGMVEGLGRVGEGAEGEFQTVIRSLDAADARLKKTLSTLRRTTTHPNLTPAEPPKSLYTFVDERSIDDVTAALRASIDTYRDAGDTLLDSTVAFDEAVANIDVAFEAAAAPTTEIATKAPGDDALDTGIGADAAASSIPTYLRNLETHATEMADLLQGLVRHYDLCVTALKHTEGGGQAAVQAAKAELDASGNDVNPQMTGLNQASDGNGGSDGNDAQQHPAPISEAEKVEMMAVLDKDAAEVDDVVAEIKDRANDMELDFESLEANLEVLKREDDSLKDIAQILQKLGSQVPAYVKAGSDFLIIWQEEKIKIDDKLAELEALRDFYEGFLTAYDSLLIEVGRRKNVQLRTEKIVHDALFKIKKLYQEDLSEREAFKAEQGEFLPSDIWPGLTKPAAHYEFRQTDQSTEIIPDIPLDVIESAIKRINQNV